MLFFGKADVEIMQAIQNETNELRTIKNTLMELERFLKSDKGQARIRELR